VDRPGLPVRQPRTLLTPAGLHHGFGLPAAIGAALALSEAEGWSCLSAMALQKRRPSRRAGSPGRRVVCVSGDGSILMNIQELATLAELDLPVAVLVFKYAQLGLCDSNRSSSITAATKPRISLLSQISPALARPLESADAASIPARSAVRTHRRARGPRPVRDRDSDSRTSQRLPDGGPRACQPSDDHEPNSPPPMLNPRRLPPRPPAPAAARTPIGNVLRDKLSMIEPLYFELRCISPGTMSHVTGLCRRGFTSRHRLCAGR